MTWVCGSILCYIIIGLCVAARLDKLLGFKNGDEFILVFTTLLWPAVLVILLCLYAGVLIMEGIRDIREWEDI